MLPFQFQPLVNIYDSDNVVVVEETNPAFEILNDDISLAGNYLNINLTLNIVSVIII